MGERKTDTATFRFNTDLLNRLKKQAEEENISLNVFVTQVLESFLDWDLMAPGAGWAVMPKSFLIELIKDVDKEEVVKIAVKSSKFMAKDISLLMKGRYDADAWISIIRDRAKRSGFMLKDYKINGKAQMVMQHDMGEKWSIYFKSYYETVFHEIGVKVSLTILKTQL